jgi:uncharacterized protein DUF4411
MTYIFDTSPLSHLFNSYYVSRFPTLWDNFANLIDGGKIISTREVLRELKDRNNNDHAETWCKSNEHIFPAPNNQEGAFVTKIFSVKHYQQIIERKKILKGGKNADPFVIAKAATIKGVVVTLEKPKPNGVKIPNICQAFGVDCWNLEQFMENERWSF